MSAAALEQVDEPGYAGAFTLALAMHLVLVGVLFVGVRWQSHAPDTVTVELWEPLPVRREPEPPKPAPRVEPPPPPKVQAKPEPTVVKPEIKVADKPKPKPERKPEPKLEAKPKPKPEAKPLPPKDDVAMQNLIREQLEKEQAAVRAQQQEQAMRDLLARQATDARTRALDAWVGQIRRKIRGNILLPPGINGNPEAIFDVVLLPTGEVLSARLRRSSGHKGYDAAVERAIQKSSPLPRPEQAELFRRELELRFRPLDP